MGKLLSLSVSLKSSLEESCGTFHSPGYIMSMEMIYWSEIKFVMG